MKFATKLVVTMSGILIFFATTISYVVYKSNIETLEKQIKGRQVDAALHIMDKIDRMLFERLADIKTIACDPIVSSRDSTPRQIRERLSEFRNYHKAYISISLFDLNRARIADTSGLDIGTQHPLDGYWEDILVGKDFIMDVSESVSLKQTVIHFGFPVKDKSGERFGIVITRMPISKLYHIIRNIGSIHSELEEWQIDLMDKDGLLLYSTYNRKGILKDNMTKWKIVRNSLASREISTGRFLHEGIEDIYVFVHEQGYLDFKGNDWNLLVHIPKKVAFAPAVKLRNIMFSIVVAILVFSVLILLLLSRSLTRPIIKLRDATIRIGKGDRNIKLDINTKDEIGELADSFIQMNNNLVETTVARNELIEEIKKGKKAEERIKASLNEKELLLNEIHHRVKNNLQIISSFLDLSSMETGDQNTIDLFTDCRNRIDSMAIIHSQLYNSKRFDQIDMGKHAHELSKRLLQIYAMEKTIELDIKCNDVYLAIDQAIPCALILNELISNTLKHAYCNKEKGTLCISIQESSNGNLAVSVKDNGIGIPEELDLDRSRSLGLTLVRNLVHKQLKGNIKVMRNGCTEFIVDFKAL